VGMQPAAQTGAAGVAGNWRGKGGYKQLQQQPSLAAHACFLKAADLSARGIWRRESQGEPMPKTTTGAGGGASGRRWTGRGPFFLYRQNRRLMQISGRTGKTPAKRRAAIEEGKENLGPYRIVARCREMKDRMEAQPGCSLWGIRSRKPHARRCSASRN